MNLTLAVSAIGLVRGLFTYKKLDALHRGFTVFLGLMLFLDVLSYLLGHVFSDNNLIVLHIYSFIELAFMLVFFKKCLFRNRQLLLMALGIAGLVYIVAEMLLIFVFRGLVIKDFAPYAKVVDNFLVILMALAFLHEKMSRYRESAWGHFRLIAVFLVFYTINTVIFLPFNFMINATNQVQFYFLIGHTLSIIAYYLYLTAEVWKKGRAGAMDKNAVLSAKAHGIWSFSKITGLNVFLLFLDFFNKK